MQDKIARNLAIVAARFGSETAGRVEDAISAYTDDVVWEAPGRNLLLEGKEAVATYYRRMLGAMTHVSWHILDRFATEDRVVDDSVVHFEVAAEGFVPFPVGTRCTMRLTHIFVMRAGRICKEIGLEGPIRAL